MFVIPALEFPSGWCCLAWSDFNPLQKAFLSFPELTSHFFFTSNESFLFQGKKKENLSPAVLCPVTIFLSSPPVCPLLLESAFFMSFTSQWEILAHGNLAPTPRSKMLSLE